jgi:PAS domain S-box-containing protein
MAKPKILLVEDENITAIELKTKLRSWDYDVIGIVSSGERAIKKVEEEKPDLILVDIVLKGEIDGIDAVKRILKNLEIPVIYLTAYADDEKLQRAKITEPYGYIIKPYEDKELKFAMEMALYKHKMDMALKESEQRYRSFLQNFKGIAFQSNMDFTPIFFHGAVKQITGYKEDDFISGKITWDQIIHPKDRTIFNERVKGLNSNCNYSFEREYRIFRKDGQKVWINEVIQNICDENNEPIRLQGTIYDITERKKVEDALKESEELFRSLVENMLDATLIINFDAEVLFANTAAANLIGLESASAGFGLKVTDFVHPEFKESVFEHISLVNEGKGGFFAEYKIKTLQNDVKWVEGIGTKIVFKGKSAEIVTLRDITDRKLSEDKIKSSLKEKEVLLREIHHRVKNNLQIISSLLSLQSSYLKDEKAMDAFRESQNRVKSIAMIHEKLYQSTDLEKIDFEEYIHSLITRLFHSYNVNKDQIQSILEIDNVTLNINTAIPCGLIINELVSNSLKHAFPDGREGKINIALNSDNGRNFELTISDDGVGFPKDVDFQNTETLGLQLVNTLVRQLEGSIELENSKGTAFKINFEEQRYKE